ncbi:MAG: AsmA family protein [Nibricoccus sp.]
MKIVLYIVGSLVALAVVAILIVAFTLGSIVKKGVNHAGPQITQTSVVLEDAKISPFSGKGTLKGLTVGNPAGWTTPRAFYLGEISIDLEPGSLTKDHIVINSIVIDQPEITFETKITTSNLQDLLKNIQKSSESGSTTPQPQPSGESKPAEPGKEVKLEVKSFRLVNAKVIVAGGGTSVPVEIPSLVMENLGTREGGLTPQQLSMAVLKEITTQVAQVGAKKAAEKGLFDKAGKQLDKLLNK